MSNARMRHARKQALIRLSRAIEKLADRADKLDATLPNGGLVGALLFMRDNRVKYLVMGDEQLSGEWRQLAIKGGMALGAKEEDAVAKWIHCLYEYGKAHGSWWLTDHGDGRYEITRLTVASAEFCNYMAEKEAKQ